MKTIQKIALLLALPFILYSCQKEEPTPEVPQELIRNVELNFIKMDQGQETTDTTKVWFGQNGQPTHDNYQLAIGSYLLYIKAFGFSGQEIQNEFIEADEAHQMFLLGAPNSSIAYRYDDNNVGVYGYFDVLQTAEKFVLRVVLAHGLNKGALSATDWNNVNYRQIAGGATDFDLKFNLALVP